MIKVPVVSPARNSTPQFTAIMPRPMGTMISGSSLPLKPKYASTKPKIVKPTRTTPKMGSSTNKVAIPGNT